MKKGEVRPINDSRLTATTHTERSSQARWRPLVLVNGLLSNATVVVVMFFFIYNIEFIGARSATTGRIVTLVLTVFLFSRVFQQAKQFIRANIFFITCFGLVLYHTIIVYLATGMMDSTQLSRIIFFFVFSIFGCLLFSTLVRNDVYRFVFTFACATCFQAFFIGYSFISKDFRLWTSEMLITSGNISMTDSFRVAGLSNSSGALLSVIQALGVFSALYAARLSKSPLGNILLIFVAIINAISTIIVGRTGLIMSTMFIVSFIAVSGNRRGFLLVVAVFIVVFFLTTHAQELISSMYFYNPLVDKVPQWLMYYLNSNASEHYFVGQTIPPLTLETLVGTGLVSSNGLNVSGSDSGYIQLYYASGLFVAFFFYSALALLFFKYYRIVKEKLLLGVLVLGLFVVEIKEPFIFKYMYTFFTLSLFYLSSSNCRLRKEVRANGSFRK